MFHLVARIDGTTVQGEVLSCADMLPSLADNGSARYLTGVSDSRWSDSDLRLINGVHGSDFDVVDTSRLVNGL